MRQTSEAYRVSSDMIRKHTSLLIIGHLTIVLLWSASLCFAAPEANEQNAAENKPSESSVFFYQMENRADPFVPFITEQAAVSKVNMDEIVDISGPLTGMQLFEPGQLKLVAVMQSGSQDIAMVEDFTGKGYVLNEGIKIGKRGVVKDIIPNAVIIEETAETRAGKKIVTEKVMTLRKEGEE